MSSPGSATRLRITVQGAVQGVGFRPFVYRLAHELHLGGHVLNSAQGVVIELEGDEEELELFRSRLDHEKPSNAVLQSINTVACDPIGETTFKILQSEGGTKTTLILPDLATCPDCLVDLNDPENRRYRYPFTNCTNCGPRFSIIEQLPYDRPNTTMKGFTLCPACRKEYTNPLDRRFHAQPNACPICGPHLEVWDQGGSVLAYHDEALSLAIDRLRQGEIIALKGLGGFQLMVDARDDVAVRELRRRKQREEKPFAVMVPSLEAARDVVEISDAAAEVLCSQAAPIVLLDKVKSDASIRISDYVAPGNPRLGVMLPTTPLHHLVMQGLGFPVVATSGNLTDEPICIDEEEAIRRLGGISSTFLVHNRPIVRPVDDSVVQLVDGEPQILRRARGYAPLPIQLSNPAPTLLAVGGHLKNSVALSVGNNIFISQHIGDLENDLSYDSFREVIGQFEGLYESPPERIIHDLHPDYLSTRFAQQQGVETTSMQHHLAHVYACMGEHQGTEPVLGLSWDGTGFGPDGTVWGGECLLVEGASWQRFAALRPFPLPGGERAVREPRRSALGLLYELLGPAVFDYHALKGWDRSGDRRELDLLKTVLANRVNTPRTSSMGRLFDAIASMLDVRQVMSFEGQAAMELEWVIGDVPPVETSPMPLIKADPGEYSPEWWIDWQPWVKTLICETDHRNVEKLSNLFHSTLAETTVEIARKAGVKHVVLTGGCFQNRTLSERSAALLRSAGFIPLIHRQVPPNDGGIAFGQLIGALGGEV
ncbi:carbamoyltransferase HypF [bacterium]|nr:carbamoyltransferase HypF [bacterium]